MIEKVIDVSNHNGNIDFAKVKDAGYKNVIIRAGLTGYGAGHSKNKDAQFEKNYAAAKAAGLNVGAYYYSCAMSETEAVTEANFFLTLLKGKTFELPVYMDVEETHEPSNMAKLGKAKLSSIVNAFCSTVEKAGFYVGFYSSKAWTKDCLDMSVLSKFTFWLAHWVTNTDYKGAYGMWQYTDSGVVSGIKGKVDVSNMMLDFPTIIKNAELNGFVSTADPNTVYHVRIGSFKDKKTANEYAAKATKEGFSAVVDPYLPGDVDGDGKVTSADAREILRKSVGLEE